MVQELHTYDYVVVGGGISGVVVASRLHESLPSASIALIEAGKDESEFELAKYTKYIAAVRGSSIDYSYDTVPQLHMDGTRKKAWAGRALSGGGAINVGAWMRGPAVDYERWAKLADDDSWTFDKLLPFFRKSETFLKDNPDPVLHGTQGPMDVQLMKDIRRGKCYPLAEPLKQAWLEVDPSLPWNEDINNGYPLGMGDCASTLIGGERQFPHQKFPLDGVKIFTKSIVARVLLRRDPSSPLPVAVGVELVDGQKIHANKEVIICAGAFNSPKILLLSGIGPALEIHQHGIPVEVDLPEVGKGFRDDIVMRVAWRLRHPERGLSLGSPALTDPDLVNNLPLDFFVWTQCPMDEVRKALEKDGIVDQEHELLHPKVVHQENYIMWMAGRSDALLAKLGLSNDGKFMCTSTYNLHPTSVGSITLSSADPLAPPVIDPNYYATETDRVIWRDALRKQMRVLLDTPSGKSFVVEEAPPPGYPQLTLDSSDREIDRRVGAFGETGSHPSGSCAMGKVVDSRLRVKGVRGLRVVDASIFPGPIATHIQAGVYVVAEKGADMIAADAKPRALSAEKL
ncbi:hypothetical protein AYL99_05199 [Fonsecaea erecta]|uniref:Glucose-methanol-choline oxidoreductase N-terminal domain-containing protein n=1 Tax=Fonsecaea erecta TaxID=1367422 RepID=A0A178ZK75_9EURO|nr:hypothetical protein AYL99_05199 [Fonsecaea erecta]OAP60197.1 hypothetical protein AYL99_05199 [Fonsecaea erecta]